MCFPFIFLFYFLTLQYCIGFAIYQHESATVLILLNNGFDELTVRRRDEPFNSIIYPGESIDYASYVMMKEQIDGGHDLAVYAAVIAMASTPGSPMAQPSIIPAYLLL